MRPRLPAVLAADPASPFPPVQQALRRPDGLLAAGGDLSPTRLLNAYRHGIFPWFSEGQPILWWSPDPRMVFHTDAVDAGRKFRRSLRDSSWRVTADTAFARTLNACARSPRPGQDGTWITTEMACAYVDLHSAGHAHSVEVWDGETLVGGIYGVAIGRMFFGESMFSAVPGGSKVALMMLARVLHGWGWPLIDAQVENPHLLLMGGIRMPRDAFCAEVARLSGMEAPPVSWTGRFGVQAASLLSQADTGPG